MSDEEGDAADSGPEISRRHILRGAGAAVGAWALGVRPSLARNDADALEKNTSAFSPSRAPTILSAENEEMLDKWQLATLNYMRKFARPGGVAEESGMAIERCDWRDVDYWDRDTHEHKLLGRPILAVGATGQGIMALLAGAKRGMDLRNAGREAEAAKWPTEQEALDQIKKIVRFVNEAQKRLKKEFPEHNGFHGAFPHWLETNGKDFDPPWTPMPARGADLVETSFLMMGLLCAREYCKRVYKDFKDDDEAQQMCKTIDKLWADVDWKWFTKNGAEDKLYWLWSPNKDNHWLDDLAIRGWNEGLVAYVMAAAAPIAKHRIPREVYDYGWGDTMLHPEKYVKSVKEARTANEAKNAHDAEHVPAIVDFYSIAGINPDRLTDDILRKIGRHPDYLAQGNQNLQENYGHCLKHPERGYDKDFCIISEGVGPESAHPEWNKYQSRSRIRDHCVIAPHAAAAYLPYCKPGDGMLDNLLHAMKKYSEDPKMWDDCGPVDGASRRPPDKNDPDPEKTLKAVSTITTDMFGVAAVGVPNGTAVGGVADGVGAAVGLAAAQMAKKKPWYARDNNDDPIYIGLHQLNASVMIENFRTGFLWDLFMGCPEIKIGLKDLGFKSPHLDRRIQEQIAQPAPSQRR